MNDYFRWSLSQVFRFGDTRSMFELAFWILLIRWAAFFRFFHRRVRKGPIRMSAGYIVCALTFAPILEEVEFRLPILWFADHGKMMAAIGTIFGSAFVFGIVHFFEEVRYVDGTRPREWASILNTAFGGFVYGSLTLLSRSIWPGIYLHYLWNGSAVIYQFLPLERQRTVARLFGET